jgi:hypothetical protein
VADPTIDVVCTTINSGGFLKPYASEIIAAGAQDRVRIIVIPDHKTPHTELSGSVLAAWDAGVSVLCPSLSEQVSFLQSCGAQDMFPWNSDGRRNIGYLMAWRDKADIMVSIDDDNLPAVGWLKGHEVVTEGTAGHVVITSDDGFYNPCDGLDFIPSQTRIWARGFPYGKRHFTLYDSGEPQPCDVVINAGLWTGDPDVDAITRLALHPVALPAGRSVVLGDGTWAPVNSQNTAVRRDVLPAYCYFESAKRFADIWQGYFAQACAKHLGQSVRFGTPYTDCRVRNDHDLLKDLELEFDGIRMLDKVLGWLTELKLSGSTYAETYECLRSELTEFLAAEHILTNQQHGLLWDVSVRMGDWLKVIGRLA